MEGSCQYGCGCSTVIPSSQFSGCASSAKYGAGAETSTARKPNIPANITIHKHKLHFIGRVKKAEAARRRKPSTHRKKRRVSRKSRKGSRKSRKH